jgi:membrane fusion protein (multidrug efflux system)
MHRGGLDIPTCGFLPAFVVLAITIACGREAPPQQPEATVPPISVSSVRVVREVISEPVLGTGTIVADKATDIGPRVSGIIDAVHVDVGTQVADGDRLFTTRQVDYRLRQQEAKQALRLANAEAKNARRRLERVEQLAHQGAASQAHLDEAQTATEMALARAGAAESAHAIASQALADTVVRAPYPGVVTRRYVDEGTMLSAQLSSAPVVQLMKMDHVEAIVPIPELQLPRVRVGTRARVRVDGTERAFETAVSVLNVRIDPTTRAFEVRLALDNADLALKPGAFVRAELLPEPRESFVLPRAALRGSEQSQFVFVAEGTQAVRRDVKTRDLDATRVEALSGVREGEQVLLGPNLPKLRQGSAIALEVARANR